MPNPEHLAILDRGVEAWNEWRRENDVEEPDLAQADLRGADLADADLSSTLLGAADLSRATLERTDLSGADLREADLTAAFLIDATLDQADLREADLTKALFWRTDLIEVDLREANLYAANFYQCDLTEANLHDSFLVAASLMNVSLERADLSSANLTGASLVEADVAGADFSGSRVYGLSAWGQKGEPQGQWDLVITRVGEEAVTVDNLEVAQFTHLLLNNEKIRQVINTVGSTGVLILGRFGERKHVLEAIRGEVRRHNLVPMVFDFERPTDRDFSETVLTLAGMSRFIIADITKPKSVALELQLAVPNFMVPFVPLIEEGERPFAMFQDLWKKHRDWVLDPLYYDSVEQLLLVFDEAVLSEANERRDLLRARKAEELITRHASDYE